MGADALNLSSPDAWVGALAYTFQIYFDFSGYSDMAIGICKMVGFDIPENFESPYTSKSITEFLEEVAYFTWSVDEKLPLHSFRRK